MKSSYLWSIGPRTSDVQHPGASHCLVHQNLTNSATKHFETNLCLQTKTNGRFLLQCIVLLWDFQT